jgi:hypothetical protein
MIHELTERMDAFPWKAFPEFCYKEDFGEGGEVK